MAWELLRGGVGCRLPAVGEQLVDAFLRPSVGELSDHISEVGQRWDLVLCAGAHEAVENGGASRGIVRATEEIVSSTEGDGPHLLLT